MLDFNDAPSVSSSNAPKGAGAKRPIHPSDGGREKDEIRVVLIERLGALVQDLWPAGKLRLNKFLVGDVMGSSGDSLELVVSGPKAGLWTDRATGDGGDVFDLIARYYQLDAQSQFPQVLEHARQWLGRVTSSRRD